jgi:hypothetical protein
VWEPAKFYEWRRDRHRDVELRRRGHGCVSVSYCVPVSRRASSMRWQGLSILGGSGYPLKTKNAGGSLHVVDWNLSLWSRSV